MMDEIPELMRHYYDSGRKHLERYRTMRDRAITCLPESVGPTWIDAQFVYDFVAMGPRTGDNQTDAEMVELAAWQTRWASVGAPTFQLTHGLAAALAMTDCDTLRWGDFQQPYDNFLVTLPHPDGPLSMLGMDDKTVVPARWIMVQRGELARDQARWRAVYDAAAAEAIRRGDYKPMCRALNDVRKAPDLGDRRSLRLVGANGLSTFSMCMAGEDDEKISDWLRPSGPVIGHATTERDNHAQRAAARLVAALCVYIAGLKAEGKLQTSPRAPREGRDPKPFTQVLGREIKLSPQLRDAARSYCEQGRKPASWKLHNRFTVRGHFRDQAVGEGRSGRKKTWIQPYWKGPVDATELARRYRVELGEENESKGK